MHAGLQGIRSEHGVQLTVGLTPQDSRLSCVTVHFGLERFRDSFDDALLADRVSSVDGLANLSCGIVRCETYPTMTSVLPAVLAPFPLDFPCAEKKLSTRVFLGPSAAKDSPCTSLFASSAHAEIT